MTQTIDAKIMLKDCLKGDRNVSSLIRAINAKIGGIVNVKFQEGKRYKIQGEYETIALEYKDNREKDMDIVRAMAVLA